MKIGLCQLDTIWEDKAGNAARADGFAREAASAGVGLLLFPEMTLTGFSMNTVRTVEAGGESLRTMAEIAERHGLNVGFGWAEASSSGKARNHYTVVSPEGRTISDYVKIHPFSFSGEHRFFESGSKVDSFRLSGFDISTFICYDLRFPEIFQHASTTSGLLVVAANWPEQRAGHWRVLLQARAIENQAYVAGVNCVGEKGGLRYSGDSMLVDPEGRIIEELAGREGLITAVIDMETVTEYRRSFPLKSDRRVDLYGPAGKEQR